MASRAAVRCYGRPKKGTWVQLLHPLVEGKLMRGFEGLDVGD